VALQKREGSAVFEGCPFCETFESRGGVIFDDGTIRIIADLCPIVPGHLLVCSVEHFRSFAQVQAPFLGDLEKYLRMARALCQVGQDEGVIMFEHGCGDHIQLSPACVDHAHIHVMHREKAARSMLSIFREFCADSGFDLNLKYRSMNLGDEVKSLDGLAYIWCLEADRSAWSVVSEEPLPRQLMRRAIAADTGNGTGFSWDHYAPAEAQRLTRAMREFLAPAEA